MVRVVSVHHFDGQIIQTCDEPLAVASAPPDRLLVALPHHVVEVKDLNANGETIFSFPTVDQVCFLEHSVTGNYVVTLERKLSRLGRETVYTRVYTNWEQSDDQPMRARIAGRVTPSSSQTSGEALEMIELPVKFSTTSCIACCQGTGNVLVGCEKWLCLYQLVMRTHDISRLKFLDFEQWPVTVELSFAPTQLAMVEDVVAAADDLCLHVFRINKGFARASDWSSSTSGSPRSVKSKRNKETPKHEAKPGVHQTIDLDELLREVSDATTTPKQRKLLGNGSLPVLALLPGIKCSLGNNPARNLRVSPFKPPHSVTMGVAIKEVPANEPWAEKMTTMVESLLQLELGSGADEGMRDEFKCLALRPLYKISSEKSPSPNHNGMSCPRLRSPNYSNLVGFNCLISTQQEGYMYHFPVEDGEVMSLGHCISTYSFTSGVKFVSLEPYLLHALTTTGLETYTMRAVNAVYEDFEEEACPPADEPVCLVGLRPFIGVVHLLLTKSFIVILSSSSDSPIRGESTNQMTLYALRLPSASTLYTDILALAASHKFTSPATYCHLLAEAHSVLKSVTLLSPNPKHAPQDIEIEMYKESCALFSDFYLISDNEDDWETGCKYCIMANLSPTQVMERLRKLESDSKEVGVDIDITQGLCYYLKKCLTNCDEDTVLPPAALNTLLDIIEGRSGESQQFLLSSLVLQSPILRQFSTERSIRIISDHVAKRGECVDPNDCLSLAVLHVTRGRLKEARDALKGVEGVDHSINQALADSLLQNWALLLDNTKQTGKAHEWDWDSVTLSEISVLLMEEKPQELATTLSSLVSKHILELQNLLQVFLTYLPSRIGTGSTHVSQVLQMFLETVFNHWNEQDSEWKPDPVDTPTIEALKILMRSYLSDLIGKGEKYVLISNKPNSMFGSKLPAFLSLLPVCPELEIDSSQHKSLLKLQCLLCSGWLDESALQELIQFVTEFTPHLVGLSLVILSQPQKALDLLLEHCPSAIPQYVKDMLTCENEWRHLIATLQSKVDEESEKTDSTKAYSQALEEVLDYLAHTLSCDVFCRVLPPGEEYESYILTCQQVAHANHVLSVIMATGQRLLATLNL